MEMLALNKRRNDDLNTLSWQVAAFQRQKRLPSLKSLLTDRDDQKERDQESRDFVKALEEAGKIQVYKGEEVTEKNE